MGQMLLDNLFLLEGGVFLEQGLVLGLEAVDFLLEQLELLDVGAGCLLVRFGLVINFLIINLVVDAGCLGIVQQSLQLSILRTKHSNFPI